MTRIAPAATPSVYPSAYPASHPLRRAALPAHRPHRLHRPHKPHRLHRLHIKAPKASATRLYSAYPLVKLWIISHAVHMRFMHINGTEYIIKQ